MTLAGAAGVATAEGAVTAAVGAAGATDAAGACAKPIVLVNKVAARTVRVIFFICVAPSCKKQMLHDEKRGVSLWVDVVMRTQKYLIFVDNRESLIKQIRIIKMANAHKRRRMPPPLSHRSRAHDAHRPEQKTFTAFGASD
jgi:hypothetical protein